MESATGVSTHVDRPLSPDGDPCTAPAELFDGSHQCEAQLPAATIVDTVHFEQFLYLNVTYDEVTAPAIYTTAGAKSFRPLVDSLVILREQAGLPVPTKFLELVGGLSPVREQNPGRGRLNVPIKRTVFVDDVPRFIQEAGDVGSMPLSPSNVSALVAGRRTYVLGDEALELIPPSPRRDEISITDLPAFLSAPTYVDGAGVRHSLQLSGGDVASLLSGRVTRISLPDASSVNLTISGTVLTPATNDPTAPASLTMAATTRPSFVDSRGPSSGISGLVGVPHLPGTDQITGLAGLTSLPLALYLPYRQDWRLRGYQRGRLINSISLAPQEEQTIEIFTWDRRRSSSESSLSADIEQSTDVSGSRHDAIEVAGEVAHSAGFDAQTGGKVGFQVGVVNADLSAGMSARTGLNDAEKKTRSTITDTTEKAANRVRTSRAFKVSESQEAGREERVTRRLRNPNQCHTLTIHFFEILAAYEVTIRVAVDDIRLVALIPVESLSAPTTFDARTVRDHETSLRAALLDRSLEPGIDAARMLVAREETCRLLCEGCDCGDPTGGNVDSAEWSAVAKAASTLLAAAVVMFTPTALAIALPLALVDIPDGVAMMKRYLAQAHLRRVHASLLPTLVGFGAVAESAVTPDLAASIDAAVGQLSADQLAHMTGDHDTDAAVKGEVFWEWMLITFGDPLTSGINTALVAANVGFGTFDDSGLGSAIATFQAAFNAWRAAAKERFIDEQRRAELRQIADEERDQRLRDLYPPKQVAEASERLATLLRHLTAAENLDHYRFAVWSERGLMFDPALFSWARAGLLEPAPIGFVGKCLAVPVRLDTNPALANFMGQSIEDLVRDRPMSSRCFTLPTPGLHAQTTVGPCTACEDFIEKTRDLQIEGTEVDLALANAELQRKNARLNHTPPLLELDPLPASLKVILTTENGIGVPSPNPAP